MVTTTFITPYLSYLLPAGVIVSTLLAWWAAAMPRLSIILLTCSLVIGQVIRIPLPGQGGGLLVSDVATVLVVIAAIFQWYKKSSIPNNTKIFITRYSLLITVCILWFLFTLLVRIPTLGAANSLIAASYWVRMSAYLLLTPALLILTQENRLRSILKTTFLLATATLVGIGYIQAMFLPDLSILRAYGWDPHQHRLVSTWLDPNFFGAFLAMTVPVLIAVAGTMNKQKKVRSIGYWVLITSIIIALALTRSRSAIAALILAATICSPVIMIQAMRLKTSAQITKRIVAIVGCISLLLVFGILSAVLLKGRLAGFWQYDPTVNLRLQSLQLAWQYIVVPHPWLGVGFNAYQFAAQEAGLISNFSIHSRAGSDNSMLTIMATTGIPGVIFFLLPWMYLVNRLAVAVRSRWLASRNFSEGWSKANDLTALAALISILTLFIHSQAVNSLLYPHLLVTIAIIIALSFPSQERLRRQDSESKVV